MTVIADLGREARFMLRDGALVLWLFVVLCFSSFAVLSGMFEVRQQRESIVFLLDADQRDRSTELSKQSDWGSAAYYSFHLTYDPPSNFAFAAMGQRDASSWKHRLRMLALEGQIYEHDPGNPELALIGRFDFSFFAAFVLPLVLILVLYDLQASERSAGRINLLIASAHDGGSLWWRRALPRSGGILLAAAVPLFAAGAFSGAGFGTLLAALVMLALYVSFWTLICLWLARWTRPAPVILAALVGVWVMLSTVLPAGSRTVIDAMVPIPAGADILMTQREAVNDAWDLPVEVTMRPFAERHSEWANYAHSGDGFDWGWYYAFQQVGDQTVEALSQAHTAGRVERERLADWFAIAAPPALLHRRLQALAGTDMSSVIAYENKVRDFHSELRTYYYPGLFGDIPFHPDRLSDLPQYSP